MKTNIENLYRFGLYPLIWFVGLGIYIYLGDSYSIWLSVIGFNLVFWVFATFFFIFAQMLDITDEQANMALALMMQSIAFVVLTIAFYLFPRIFIFEHYTEVHTPTKVKVYQMGSQYHMDAVIDGNKTVTFFFPKGEAQRLAKMTDVSKFTITTEHRYNGFIVAKHYKTDSEYNKKVNEVILSEIK